MRSLLLASTMLALGTGIAAAQTITPGNGSLTDAGGNAWLITSDGSVQENGQWTPGGGGTAALTIVNGAVYGLDATGKGWFTLSGQYWISSAAPPGVAATAPAGAGTPPAAAVAIPAAASDTATTTATTAAPVMTCAPTPGGAASSGFTTSNGSIIAPDGSVFIARGIDVQDSADLPSAAQLQADFPGINFVRVASYSYDSPASMSAYVTDLTSHGIVIEFSDYSNSTGADIGGGLGVAYTGSQLAAETNWYASLAKAFANNPSVWFGTDNEPPQGGLSAWELQTYNAIRSAGNTAPVLMEVWGGGVPGQMNAGLDPSVFAAMTNIVWDVHFYGWQSNYSNDQATVNAALAGMIAEAQTITSANGKMPVIIGEYGITTSATGVDANGPRTVSAVHSSGNGSSAWVWDYGAANSLTDGGGNLTSFGQTISGYIALVANAPASIWSAACNAPAVATSAASVTVAQAAAPAAGATQATPSAVASAIPDTSALDTTAAAQQAAAQAAIAAAETQASATAAAVQQANTTGARADAILARVLATVGAAK